MENINNARDRIILFVKHFNLIKTRYLKTNKNERFKLFLPCFNVKSVHTMLDMLSGSYSYRSIYIFEPFFIDIIKISYELMKSACFHTEFPFDIYFEEICKTNGYYKIPKEDEERIELLYIIWKKGGFNIPKIFGHYGYLVGNNSKLPYLIRMKIEINYNNFFIEEINCLTKKITL